MTLEELRGRLGTLPTMMTAAEELQVIEALEQVPDAQILAHLDQFFPLLWALFDSHTGSAIFEVDSSSVVAFQAFADRLAGLAARVGSARDAERLSNAADGFRRPFSM